jgi:hypothetical protein
MDSVKQSRCVWLLWTHSCCATHESKGALRLGMHACTHVRHANCAATTPPQTRTLIGCCWCLVLRKGRMRRSSCSPGRLLRDACEGAPPASATPTQATGDAIALPQQRSGTVADLCCATCLPRHSQQLSPASWPCMYPTGACCEQGSSRQGVMRACKWRGDGWTFLLLLLLAKSMHGPTCATRCARSEQLSNQISRPRLGWVTKRSSSLC